MISGDASEFYALANDLAQVGARAVGPMRGVIAESGEAFVQEWKANATETAGEHGKHYPNAIEARMALTMSTIAVDVGPNAAMPQGGMSFEFGSENQPPHLDGLRALETVAPRVERMVDSALGYLFP